KNSRMKVERLDLNTVIENAAPQSGDEPALADLPKTGILPFGRSKAAKKAAEAIAAANKVAYDPYETIEIKPNDNITGETVEKRPKAPAEGKKPETKPAENKDGAKPETAVAPEELAEPAALQVYQRPPISLLRRADHSEQIANDSPTEKAKLLIETLASFNINARVVNISVGPVITRFEIQPAQGVRVNRITSLSNDIALALAAPRVRIEAPIPGKAAVGIEIPNKDTAMVRLREVLDTREFSAASSPLTFALGKDIAGKPVYADLERMPHMLIAGATGSGKSVCINSIILSTVYKSSPDEVRMILIDPKVVELSIFAPIPHLYCPIVNDPKKAAGVLKWACVEMDKRYNKMSTVNARDLARYNSQMKDPADRMPRLMIIIDELADLMIVSAKDVEESIARLAQLGRAAGIHLIVATQRPSVDVLTGLIKANIPSRIAFAVSSAIDSRVILDGSGAEKLLGHGDMLFHPNGAAKPIRAQGAYVSDEEVENIMQFFVDHKIEVPQDEKIINFVPDLTGSTGQGNGKQEDDLLPDAVRIVMDSGSASISMIQRRLRVGYARATRLVDIMEQMKLVSGFDGSKPRKVLITEAGYQELFGGGYTPPADTDEDMVDVPFDTEDE
ncbi:MAG: DNA translocase FtsK, partial [Clostridia bacterium]|nr:DNA translocase FtsK [Clostridia bacterium]